MYLKKPGTTKIPPAVVKNFLFLNLLIGLTLAISALGLHYFLRPRVVPTFVGPAGGEHRPIGIMVFWEIQTGTARRLLFEGMPILKHNHNP